MLKKLLNSGMDPKDYTEESREKKGSNVDIAESESSDPDANIDPGRTPGKAEGVDDPEKEGNE